MKIYVVTLRWIDTPMNPEMIDSILAVRGDWLRWNGWTWLLASNYPPSELRIAIMGRLTAHDGLIIAQLVTADMEGWAPKWVWEWISERSNPDFRLPAPIPPPPPPPRPPSWNAQPQGFFESLSSFGKPK